MQRNDFFSKPQPFIKFYYHFKQKKATFLYLIELFSSLLFLFYFAP
jgi:hypothetical protein